VRHEYDANYVGCEGEKTQSCPNGTCGSDEVRFESSYSRFCAKLGNKLSPRQA